jgi:hypothetical protein
MADRRDQPFSPFLPWAVGVQARSTAWSALLPASSAAIARAKAVSLATIAGSDNYRAQAATQAMGLASVTVPTTVGNVAAMIAGWGDLGATTPTRRRRWRSC